MSGTSRPMLLGMESEIQGAKQPCDKSVIAEQGEEESAGKFVFLSYAPCWIEGQGVAKAHTLASCVSPGM